MPMVIIRAMYDPHLVVTLIHNGQIFKVIVKWSFAYEYAHDYVAINPMGIQV